MRRENDGARCAARARIQARIDRMEDITLRKRNTQAGVPDDFEKRFIAEKAALQRHYRTVFKLWERCT